MGRRRSTNKHIPMSLSIPYSLVVLIDRQLSFKQSRSKWVQSAIKAKLEAQQRGLDDLEHLSTRNLLIELLMRSDDNSKIKPLIKSALQFVGTEE
tara:strand:- start:159 stop:443 length:285 start_codon:yes stop_codon:yes gene_type:complete